MYKGRKCYFKCAQFPHIINFLFIMDLSIDPTKWKTNSTTVKLVHIFCHFPLIFGLILSTLWQTPTILYLLFVGIVVFIIFHLYLYKPKFRSHALQSNRHSTTSSTYFFLYWKEFKIFHSHLIRQTHRKSTNIFLLFLSLLK